eukprot:snap_masked-scaffold_7-processed-gene-7.18-mRNA-1 protein AED:1.00 eAED:1.00 QI:0/0/0/0/1/1/2/0/90
MTELMTIENFLIYSLSMRKCKYLSRILSKLYLSWRYLVLKSTKSEKGILIVQRTLLPKMLLPQFILSSSYSDRIMGILEWDLYGWNFGLL